MRRENTGAAGDGRPFSLAHTAKKGSDPFFAMSPNPSARIEKGSDPFFAAHVHIAKAALEVTPRNL
jgi:hypothetical protein